MSRCYRVRFRDVRNYENVHEFEAYAGTRSAAQRFSRRKLRDKIGDEEARHYEAVAVKFVPESQRERAPNE